MELKIEIKEGYEIRGIKYKYCCHWRGKIHGKDYGCIRSIDSIDKFFEEEIKQILEIWKKK